MRRFITIIFLCCIVISCFTFPASAAESFFQPYEFQDLMKDSFITWGYARNDYPNFYDGFNIPGRARVFYNLDIPPINFNLSDIYLTIFVSTNDLTDVLLYTSDTASSIAGTLVGSYVSYTGYTGTYYQYRFSGLSDIEDLTFNVRLPGNHDYRMVGLCSVVAFGHAEESLQQASVYQYKNYWKSVDGVQFHSRDLYDSGTKTLPYVSEHIDIMSDIWLEDEYYIDITDYITQFDNYDSAYFLIDTVGDMYDVRCSLYTGGSSPSGIADIDYWQVDSFEEWGRGEQNHFAFRTTLIKVDLSDIDLNNVTFDLSFSLEPLNTGANKQYGVTYLRIRNIWMKPIVTDVPWYARFWNWMSGGLTSLGDRITGKLDELLGDPEGDELQQGGEQIKDDASQAAADQELLNVVTRPSVDAGAMVDQYTNFDTGAVNVLSTITSNEYVGAILILVVTFALIGYIFYGKK